MDVIAKKYADSLWNKVSELIVESQVSKHPKPMLYVLQPIIDEIAKLRVAIERLESEKNAKLLPPSADPLITGRTPTPWMVENAHKIRKDDFYDESRSEDDLRRKYS